MNAFLGPLPHPWKSYRSKYNGFVAKLFKNLDTGKVIYEDPRLGPLLEGCKYEETTYEPEQKPPEKFRHMASGEVTSFNPRLSAEALAMNGVPIERISLI